MLFQVIGIGMICTIGFIALAAGIWFYVGDKDAALALILYLSLCFVTSMCIYFDSKKETEPEFIGTSCCSACHYNSED